LADLSAMTCHLLVGWARGMPWIGDAPRAPGFPRANSTPAAL